MKGLLKFFAGALLGVIAGWVLGFLRLPMVEKDAGFWVGLVGGAGGVLLVVGAWMSARNHAKVLQQIAGSESRRAYHGVWIPLALLIGFSGLLSTWLVYRQNGQMEVLAKGQAERIEDQTALITSIRSSQQVFLISNVLENVDRDLREAPGLLSDATIARIAALSYSFKPYRSVEGDSLSPRPLSPERGQLLVALAAMPIDSLSWLRLKGATSFASADLSGANLSHADLSGINLHSANLRDALLDHADLTAANLHFASLWGARLNHATLTGANLTVADLRWAEANGCTAAAAIFNGADLRNAQFRKANLRGAKLRCVPADVAQFQGADLRDADLKVCQLDGANLNHALLQGSNLKMVDFKGANLADVAMDSVRVGGDSWAKVKEEWHYDGDVQAWEQQYEIVKDTTKRFEAEHLFLPKKRE